MKIGKKVELIGIDFIKDGTMGKIISKDTFFGVDVYDIKVGNKKTSMVVFDVPKENIKKVD